MLKLPNHLALRLIFTKLIDHLIYNHDTSALAIIPLYWKKMPIAGRPDPLNTPVVIDAIRQAAVWSQSGAAAGVVTNPIQKSCLDEAGFRFPGHTEYLSSLATTMPGGPLMMLACDKLRVVPATIHIPLNKVSKTIPRV